MLDTKPSDVLNLKCLVVHASNVPLLTRWTDALDGEEKKPGLVLFVLGVPVLVARLATLG
jgi:hypothetical protein